MKVRKKKCLVETTGSIGSNVYTAPDPDEACRLARRHETFVRLVATKPGLTGEQAIAQATDFTDKGAGLPGFSIRRVTEVKHVKR